MPNFNAGKELAEANKRMWDLEQEELLRYLSLPPNEAHEAIGKFWKKKERDRRNRIISCIILFLLTCWFVHWFINLVQANNYKRPPSGGFFICKNREVCNMAGKTLTIIRFY